MNRIGETLTDRVLGVVLGGAVGDALGAGYEFLTPPPLADDVEMLPGRLTHDVAGHWTDDTAMAIGVLRAIARHGRLDSDEALSDVAAGFLKWFRSDPPDVGRQTRDVLSSARGPDDVSRSAAAYQMSHPERAGNGSLMRTGPVALAHLGDSQGVARSAAAVSALTHPHIEAVEACVLWSCAVEATLTTGALQGPEVGLAFLDDSRRDLWSSRIRGAEAGGPEQWNPNGFVVSALQAAWWAITSTRGQGYESGVRAAVAIGDDTDTVASIAGALLGAAYGASSIPREWRAGLGGWPGYDEDELSTLTLLAVEAGRVADH